MDKTYRNPLLTVDAIIETESGIILIERKNPPYGWALPGGFVDYGESLETAVIREAREETSLDIDIEEQFHAYSDPYRDPRKHTVSVVFIVKHDPNQTPYAMDDAKALRVFPLSEIPEDLAFDHGKIISDYIRYKNGESKKGIFRR
ncbi:NUDIX domain-containing protein [Desulforegula conservatrix]|uniref:NUDIX domain-containing protein n=1 Tax=Desulforegula conservatrix TaxID=153026 RepID=UPI000421D6A6|nr:NUDIX hydrolase [Desulforegula conservatrix]